MKNHKTIKSISFDQTEILESIIKLYCPEGFEADASYGNGCFYKDIPVPKYIFDIDPQLDGVLKSDSRNLPLTDSSLNNIVFDPPFLTYIKSGREKKDGKSSIMASRFSGYWSYSELQEHYISSLKEFKRVLNHKGICIFKCQDIIHNHKMHCTHYNVIKYAQDLGFRLKDIFILCASHRMPSPQKGIQKHARIYHSYFLIFQNWKPKSINDK